MRFSTRLSFCALLIASATSAQTAPPTTKSSLTGICYNEVRFTLPAGWDEVRRGRDDIGIILRQKGIAAQITVMASPADPESFKDPEAGAKLGEQLLAKRKNTAGANKIEFVKEPTLQPDKRFLFKIHEQYKDGDKTLDQIYAARRVGAWVVTVIVANDSADQAALDAVRKTGERFLDSMIPGVRQKPGDAATRPAPAPAGDIDFKAQKVAIPKAKLSVPVPDGWKEEIHNNPDGIVAVMRDALEGSRMIVISVRPLPPEAIQDPKMRDMIIDDLAKRERVTFKLEGGAQAGPQVPIKDARFARKSITELESQGIKLKLDSRQRVLGNRIISVSSVSLDADYQKIADLADQMAMGVE